MNKWRLMFLPMFCMAKMASTACDHGTKYSACNSFPLLGVKPILKCGNRSYHGPGTPICSVQFSAESVIIGCKFFVAGFAPKKSVGVADIALVVTLLFTHTSLI